MSAFKTSYATGNRRSMSETFINEYFADRQAERADKREIQRARTDAVIAREMMTLDPMSSLKAAAKRSETISDITTQAMTEWKSMPTEMQSQLSGGIWGYVNGRLRASGIDFQYEVATA